MNRNAPVAIFAFRRPDVIGRMFESLRANPEAMDTPVYVFSDGARGPADEPSVAATRAVIRTIDHPNLTVIERDRNYGLATNIIDGVSRLCAEYGTAIILEDDLVVSPTFLRYMNDAFERYRADECVYHVSGYQYPLDLRAHTDSVFLPFINSSGWGTWSRAWKAFDPGAAGFVDLAASSELRRRFDLGGRYPFFRMLQGFKDGRLDSWAIRWYLSVFMRSGLALFPAKSLVQNLGFGDGATNTNHKASRQFMAVAHPCRVETFPETKLDRYVVARVSEFLGWEYSLRYRVIQKVRRMVRPILE